MANRYRSKFEATVAKKLRAKKVKFEYEASKYPYTQTHYYTTDFRLPNGIYIETKGNFTSKDRSKHLQVQKENPELDIRFVFQRNNKLNKKSKTHYSDWCDKHGFKWAIGEVPQAWINEKK